MIAMSQTHWSELPVKCEKFNKAIGHTSFLWFSKEHWPKFIIERGGYNGKESAMFQHCMSTHAHVCALSTPQLQYFPSTDWDRNMKCSCVCVCMLTKYLKSKGMVWRRVDPTTLLKLSEARPSQCPDGRLLGRATSRFQKDLKKIALHASQVTRGSLGCGLSRQMGWEEVTLELLSWLRGSHKLWSKWGAWRKAVGLSSQPAIPTLSGSELYEHCI